MDSKKEVSDISKTARYLDASSLSELHVLYKKDHNIISDVMTKFYGWVRRTRIGGGGTMIFVDLYDGTEVGELMCLATSEFYVGNNFKKSGDNADELSDSYIFTTLELSQLSETKCLSDGCSVVVDGKLVLSPAKAVQNFELQIHRLRVIGSVEDPVLYPIQKSSVRQLTVLRQLPFMRMRAQIMQCLFRISAKLELGIHIFMDSEGVTKIDPNIITMSDCEGAGDTFQVSPPNFSKNDKGEYIPVGLTVSSQLPLEAAITGLKQVYTSQKSFRAEKSDTPKHLAEFYHIEYEGAFKTLDTLIAFTEKHLKYIIRFTLNSCSKDMDFIESKFAPMDIKPTRDLLRELIDKPFVKIKHCAAVDLIIQLVRDKIKLPDEMGRMKCVRVEKLPEQGKDLGSEHEKLLVRYFGWITCTDEEKKQKLEQKKEFGSFVFLTHWPLAIKSFYMKQCDDDSGECESFDLLAPRVGELFGGSMREWRFDKLIAEIKRRSMDPKPIQWFLDLRKSGSIPHGGWGMGFARLCMLMTGSASVRDVVFLPVYYGHCPY